MTDLKSTAKHKGGRPRAAEARVKRLSVRLTDAEHQEIDALVKRSGMSKSEAARLLFFNADLPEKVPGGVHQNAAKLYSYLQPMQSNLNQIAHHLNSRKISHIDPRLVTRIQQEVKQVEGIVKKFRNWVLTAHPNIAQ